MFCDFFLTIFDDGNFSCSASFKKINSKSFSKCLSNNIVFYHLQMLYSITKIGYCF